MKYLLIVIIIALLLFGCSKSDRKEMQSKLDDANKLIEKNVDAVEKTIDITGKQIKNTSEKWLIPVYVAIDKLAVQYDLTAEEVKDLKRKAAHLSSKEKWDSFLMDFLKDKKQVEPAKKPKPKPGQKRERRERRERKGGMKPGRGKGK